MFASRPGAKVKAQELFRNRLLKCVESRSASNRPPRISEFSERIEATSRFETTYFGSLHNDGHILISLHDDDPKKPGCLFWESITVRDPVFYQWHSHVDKLFRKYQDLLDPYDFSHLPPVELKELSVTTHREAPNTLLTDLRDRKINPQNTLEESKADVANPILLEYLSHEDFSYRLTARNKSDASLRVTIRIFLAPEQSLDDRTSWIEMDKFQNVLAAGETTFERSSKSSSVARHPIWTAPMLEGQEPPPNEFGAPPGCRCGWPYTLLLPRGTPEGMKFRLAALITAGDDIDSKIGDKHNSSSYCGLIDSEYPDRRAMGYPFDRRFDSAIRQWLDGQSRPAQLTSTLVTIKHNK